LTFDDGLATGSMMRAAIIPVRAQQPERLAFAVPVAVRKACIDRATGERRFDVGFLAERLLLATDWIAADEATASLPVGYFGASTGAAAALIAAAEQPATAAVVSRGGRPDLAEAVLDRVDTPTLLILGATHLFEELSTLDELAQLACDWFVRYL
jgi:dienelactone hydrolase